MARPPKLVPEEAIREALAPDADVPAIARKHGVNLRTLRRRIEAGQARPAPIEEPVTPDAMQRIPPPERPALDAPPAGSIGGEDAAAAAAGIGGSAKPEADKPEPKGPPPGPAPEAVVALAELVTSITVRCCALGWGIPVTREVEALGSLTMPERAQLLMLAPYAAPYIEKLLRNMDKVGAALFGLAYVLMVGRRLADLKARRPKAKKPPAPAPAPAPAEVPA